MSELTLDQLDSDLDREIEHILEHYKVIGAGIALVKEGQPYLKTYGVKELGKNDPVFITTAFNIGSNSKAFTSAITALLVAEGKLDWDDPIIRFVPEFALNDPWLTKNVTLRDLCGNRTGLTRSGFCEFASNAEIDVLDILRRLKYSRLESGLRERFTYANPGHIAVAVAVSRVAGMDYIGLLNERIWKPAGMVNCSGGALAEKALTDRAGWHCQWRGKSTPITPTFTDNVLGSGGLWLSVSDAARWLQLHLGAGVVDGTQIIPPKALQETYLPQIVVRPEDLAPWIGVPETSFAAYCLGWATSELEGHRVLRHSGSDLGISAQTAFVPERGVGVAVYLNKKDSTAALEVSYSLLGYLLGIDRDWREMLLRPLPDTGLQHERILSEPEGQAELPLSAYVGTYISEGDGPAVVTRNGEQLFVDFLRGTMYSSDLYPLGGHDFLPIARNPANEFNLRVRSRFTVIDGKPVRLSVPEVGEFFRATNTDV